MKYARVLLEHCPQDATQLFVDYFTGHYQPKRNVIIVEAIPQQQGYGAGALNAVQYV
jgi:vacuolar protein sorting-associated protein 11